jgi:hypothetical protein
MKKIISLLLISFVFGFSFAKPEIEIENPWVREASKFSGVSAAYMVIKNNGDEADYLIDAYSDVAKMTQIHKMIFENGIARMERVKEIKISPKSEVKLTGNYHIMLMKLKKDLKKGEHVKIVLTFKKSGKIVVDAVVKSLY